MMFITKKEVLEAALRGEGALGRAADDEPVFVLRAQDCFSDELVESWALKLNTIRSPIDIDGKIGHKITMAKNVASAMLHWPTRRVPD